MARDSRSKPNNVVKSRSAPSLLGGFASARQREELPSNRFIELGDVALGNLRRAEPYGEAKVPREEAEFESERHHRFNGETEMVPLPDVPVLSEVQKPPKPPKMSLPIPRPPKPPRLIAKQLPAGIKTTPLTRPKPPKPPAARPKLAMPPKSAPPKPPKLNRPKPFTGRLEKPSNGRRSK